MKDNQLITAVIPHKSLFENQPVDENQARYGVFYE